MLKMLFVFLSSFIAGTYQEIASATEESIRDARAVMSCLRKRGFYASVMKKPPGSSSFPKLPSIFRH